MAPWRMSDGRCARTTPRGTWVKRHEGLGATSAICNNAGGGEAGSAARSTYRRLCAGLRVVAARSGRRSVPSSGIPDAERILVWWHEHEADAFGFWGQVVARGPGEFLNPVSIEWSSISPFAGPAGEVNEERTFVDPLGDLVEDWLSSLLEWLEVISTIDVRPHKPGVMRHRQFVYPLPGFVGNEGARSFLELALGEKAVARIPAVERNIQCELGWRKLSASTFLLPSMPSFSRCAIVRSTAMRPLVVMKSGGRLMSPTRS
jgi:hypothetical protein